MGMTSPGDMFSPSGKPQGNKKIGMPPMMTMPASYRELKREQAANVFPMESRAAEIRRRAERAKHKIAPGSVKNPSLQQSEEPRHQTGDTLARFFPLVGFILELMYGSADCLF